MPLTTNVAIFAIDPGGTTGVAAGVFDLRRLTVKAAITRARAKGNIETWNVKGTNTKQCWTIARAATDFYYKSHVERMWVAYDGFFVVSEDFNLRQMSADLSPVARNAGIETLLEPCFEDRWETVYEKQSASEAKSFCSDQMLDRWGLLKGKTPHERDALRHLARRLDKLL